MKTTTASSEMDPEVKRTKPPYVVINNGAFGGPNDAMYSFEAGDVIGTERVASLVRTYAPEITIIPIDDSVARAIANRLSPGRRHG